MDDAMKGADMADAGKAVKFYKDNRGNWEDDDRLKERRWIYLDYKLKNI